MRLAVVFCCAAAVGSGCQHARFGRYSALGAGCEPAGGAAACPPATGTWGGPPGAAAPGDGTGPANGPNGAPGTPCPPGQPGYGPGYSPGYGPNCGPGPQPCPPKEKEVKSPPREAVRAPAPEREVTETTTRGVAAIAPDILLIPKTVLVPYAPHVPTGPVRVKQAALYQNCVETEERVTTPGPVRQAVATTPNPNAELLSALDKLVDQVKATNARVGELEAKLAARPAPVPCPPVVVGPACPPPGVVYPGPAVPTLPAPRAFPPSGLPPMVQPLPVQ